MEVARQPKCVNDVEAFGVLDRCSPHKSAQSPEWTFWGTGGVVRGLQAHEGGPGVA